MWRRDASRLTVLGVAVAIFVVCCLLPLGYLLYEFVITADASFSALRLDVRQRGLLYNTAVLGTSTAVVATAIGAPLGVMLARVPLRGKDFIRLALVAPVLLPPYVVALAWTYVGARHGFVQALLGREFLPAWTYSLPAVVGVLSLVLYPLSMLATEVAIRRIDGRLEEAALMSAPPGRTWWRITLPLAAPSIAAASLVIFVLAISEFAVAGLLQVRVYTTEVFTAFAALYDFPRAMLLAMPLLLLSVAVAAIAAVVVGDRLVTPRRLTGTTPLVLNDWHAAARVGCVGTVSLALVLPVAILVREALQARSLGVALAGSGTAIVNSLTLAALAATLMVGIALWLAYARVRSSRRLGYLSDIGFVVLFAVPSTIMGIGLIGLWNRPGALGAPYGTDVMLLLAYAARFLPVAVLILAAMVRYVPVSHEEAAAVTGAGWLRTMSRIVVPQIHLGIAATWTIVFVLAFGELGASILVAPPGESTLPIRIYTLIANTPPSSVAALALLQALVIFTPLAIAGAVMWRRVGR
jgi:iron(III) transport system permease protein